VKRLKHTSPSRGRVRTACCLPAGVAAAAGGRGPWPVPEVYGDGYLRVGCRDRWAPGVSGRSDRDRRAERTLPSRGPDDGARAFFFEEMGPCFPSRHFDTSAGHLVWHRMVYRLLWSMT